MDSQGPADTVQSATLSDEILTERDLAVLDFERHWWKSPGSKDTAIRQQFELSPTRYYQIVNALIDTELALRHDPLLVKRLRRTRYERRRARRTRAGIPAHAIAATAAVRR